MIATATVTDVGVRTAVVRAADGVRFSVSAADAAGLTTQIVEYVAGRCDDVLWPAAAREVRQLIATHRHSDALEVYFSNVGLRWDEEWLEVKGTEWSGGGSVLPRRS